MDYDTIITKIGEFGKYQKIILPPVMAMFLVPAFHTLGIVFTGANVDHVCRYPELDHLNLSWSTLANLTAFNVKLTGGHCYKMDMVDKELLNEEDVSSLLGQTSKETVGLVSCRENGGWEYDKSIYISTVVTEFDLVCEKKWMVATSSSVFMAGLMVGVLTFGLIGDRFGRRISMAIALLIVSAFSMAIPFVTDFTSFVVVRFFTAVGNVGAFTIAFVYVVEMVGPGYRSLLGTLGECFWAIGYIIIPGLAYLFRDWRSFQLAMAIPGLLYIPIPFLIPESPRWLLTQNRVQEAETILKKIAKVNGNAVEEIPPIYIPKAQKVRPWDLVRTPRMRWRSLNIFFNWAVNSLVYYGLSLNTSNLGGNPYINFLIAGAIEFPAYLVCLFTLRFLGRRYALSTAFLLGGFALLAIMFVPEDQVTVSITLAMIGKFFITMSFNNVYVFSAELFPTVVRSLGVSSGSFFARVGGAIAPFMAQLSVYGSWIPLLVFGSFAVAAGVLTMLLPETKGVSLPETIEEGEAFGGRGCIPSNFWGCGYESKVDVEDKETKFGLDNPALETTSQTTTL